ncbi:hypothetical protein Clacol_007144 [Clathrus columnatus]|uniref:Uncharacterized protein n=1 Tax=Clathrus columnatus TaxID=1419009 RepID=A0AAV5AJN8_9AGAM|nr:hypothetical protein Clacol_007144 [Clathrus columnatus]
MSFSKKLVTAWFLITTPVILWDAGPRSMVGGDLHWIWKPYALYQEIDYVYGVRALENNEGFTNAQSFMNIVETALNLYYLYLTHIVESPSAPVYGFASIVMTFGKTALYHLQELWLVVPAYVISVLGKEISASLQFSAKAKKTLKKA